MARPWWSFAEESSAWNVEQIYTNTRWASFGMWSGQRVQWFFEWKVVAAGGVIVVESQRDIGMTQTMNKEQDR